MLNPKNLKNFALVLVLGVIAACGAGGSSSESSQSGAGRGGLHEGIFTSGGPIVGSTNGMTVGGSFFTNFNNFANFPGSNNSLSQRPGMVVIPLVDSKQNVLGFDYSRCFFAPATGTGSRYSQTVDLYRGVLLLAVNGDEPLVGKVICGESQREVVVTPGVVLDDNSDLLNFVITVHVTTGMIDMIPADESTREAIIENSIYLYTVTNDDENLSGFGIRAANAETGVFTLPASVMANGLGTFVSQTSGSNNDEVREFRWRSTLERRLHI